MALVICTEICTPEQNTSYAELRIPILQYFRIKETNLHTRKTAGKAENPACQQTTVCDIQRNVKYY